MVNSAIVTLPFPGKRTWEQNIVLQVDVLVEILLKLLERAEQRAVADASVTGQGKVVRGLPDLTKLLPGVVVLHHHYMNRILD